MSFLHKHQLDEYVVLFQGDSDPRTLAVNLIQKTKTISLSNKPTNVWQLSVQGRQRKPIVLCLIAM
jgi:hypothetical protein